jgi:hypothetical protein
MKTFLFQNRFKVISALMMVFAFSACSKKSSLDAVCGKAGMFANSTDCQSNSGGSSCVMTTTASDSGSVMCWSVSQNQNSQNQNVGPNYNSSACSPSYDTSLQPSSCSYGVTQQTVTRTCKPGCTCGFTSPYVTYQPCVADINDGINGHYTADCTQGIEVINGKKLCKFAGSSCPSGFSPYVSGGYAYTTTAAEVRYHYTGCKVGLNRFTGSHPTEFKAEAPESKTYCSGYKRCWGTPKCVDNPLKTFSAKVTQILCF